MLPPLGDLVIEVCRQQLPRHITTIGRTNSIAQSCVNLRVVQTLHNNFNLSVYQKMSGKRKQAHRTKGNAKVIVINV